MRAEVEKLPQETAAARAAHVEWGVGKLAEIARRHEVAANDPAAIHAAVQAETARLREAGEPLEKRSWPETEFQGAVFALEQAEKWGIAYDLPS